MTDDAGASPAVCPRCGRVDVNCEDAAAIERAINTMGTISRIWLTPTSVKFAIRAFLGCPR